MLVVPTQSDDDEDDRKRPRDEEDNEDTGELKRQFGEQKEYLGEFLAQGGYNSVFMVKGKQRVVRIAAIGKDDRITEPKLLRGAAIVELFNRYKLKLGPSLFNFTSPPKVVSARYWDHDETFRREMLPKYPALQYKFYMQEMEFLTGGTLYRSRNPTFVGTFALVWLVWVAQKLFGFRHRDIALNNIVLKVLDEPITLRFSTGDRHFVFNHVAEYPVLIDYDLGSVSVTSERIRNRRVGKPGYAPPEMCLAQQKIDSGDEYDWWSLGIVLLFWWTKGAWRPILPDTRNVNLQGLWVGIRAFCFVNRTTEPPQQGIVSPDLAEIIASEQNQWDEVRNSMDIRILVLLRRLLSWDPKDRHVDLALLTFLFPNASATEGMVDYYFNEKTHKILPDEMERIHELKMVVTDL